MKVKTCYVFPKPLYLLGIMLLLGCISHKYNTEITDFRTNYKLDFNTNSHAPLKGQQLDSMRFFPTNKKFRFIADVKPSATKNSIQVPTSSGKIKKFQEYALVTFVYQGNKHQLTLYQNQQTINIPKYKDLLFLPFNDETNGESTYGGGRYIDIKIQDIKENKLVIDFNKSYNPYCHYSSGYNCPIPPPNNFLDMAVLAGEKTWIGTYIGYKNH